MKIPSTLPLLGLLTRRATLLRLGVALTSLMLPLVAMAAPVQPHDGSSAAPVMVGYPTNPASLNQEIQNAYNAGARHIVIRPGTYTLPNVGHSVISLDGWQEATLSAYGVTLVLTDLAWNHNLCALNNCAGVTIEGPTLTQSSITSYQGRVVAMGKDDKGKVYCDWRLDKGYPVPPAAAKKFPSAINVVDAHTRLLKMGVGDFYDAPMESQGNGTFRVHFNQATENFEVGDWFVGRYGNAPFKAYLGNSRNCTLKDITMLRNGFSPIREEGGGGNHILHCKWILGPRSDEATEASLISGAADGLHSTGANPGPDIENCVFEGVILDDCIAIHGGFQAVKSATGNTLTLDNGWA